MPRADRGGRAPALPFCIPRPGTALQLLEEGIDSPLLLGQLLFHRMGGAAYTVLERTGLLGRVNREVRTSLQTVYEVNRIKTDSFRTMLTLLARTLEGWRPLMPV